MVEYHELLKDPRWIRKRKKVLKRDGYKCTVCGSTKNLRVHHTFYYKKETPPWGYPMSSLLTVCDDCHHNYHESHELTIVGKNPKNKYERKKNKRKQSYNVYLDVGKKKKRKKKTRLCPITPPKSANTKYLRLIDNKWTYVIKDAP